MRIPFRKIQSLCCDFVFPMAKSDIPPERLAHFLNSRRAALTSDGIIFTEISNFSEHQQFYAAHVFGNDAYPCIASCEALCAIAAYFCSMQTLTEVRFLCDEKMHHMHVLKKKHHMQISTFLPAPSFDASNIGLKSNVSLLGQRLKIEGTEVALYAVKTDKPYVVTFDFANQLNSAYLQKIGLLLSLHPLFSRGISVVFTHITSKKSLSVRIFDQRFGELYASGGGAAAAVAVANLLGYCPIQEETKVKMRGGQLEIYTERMGKPFLIHTEAHHCFDGMIEFDGLTGEIS